MKLNSFERLVVNQPLRPFTQRWLEARPLRRLGGPVSGRVLEIGCGQGLGAQIIQRDFGADEVHGFDLDERQLRRAQQRLKSQASKTSAVNGDASSIRVWRGSADQIPVECNSYDAAFDFNVLHHMPDWQSGVSEIARVLRPGGKFYLLETLRFFLNNPINRVLMKHPRKNRFDVADLQAELRGNGFSIRGQRTIPGCFHWLVAELDPPSAS